MVSQDSTIPLFKICTACKKEKIITQFGKQRLGKYGRRSTCLVCHNGAGRVWKKANKKRRTITNRLWKQRHPANVRASRKRCSVRAVETGKAQIQWRASRQRNRTKRLISKHLWELNNPQAMRRIKHREYIKHKEQYLFRNARWQEENPHLVRQYALIAAQRRRIRGYRPSRAALRYAIQETLESYRIGDKYWDCYAGKLITKPTIDHIIPITAHGPTVFDNLCVTSRALNASKGTKSLLVWLAQRCEDARK